jgi:hypothetical protein
MAFLPTGSRTQRTEKGSHASENVHLAGIESSKTDYLVQLFCMKMTFPQEGDYDWMPGGVILSPFTLIFILFIVQ